jgi:hypothetical protein
LPHGCRHENDGKRQAKASGAGERFVEIDVSEGNSKQNDADDDGRHRHDLDSGRNVVDVDGFAFLEIVDVLNAAAGFFLDWTARLVFLLLALLAAEAPWWSRGTEIRRAITRGTGRTAGTRTESAAPEPAAKAAARRTRPGRAARAWASKATRTGRTRRSVFARARFTYREIPSLEWLRVELPDDLFGDRAVGEFDERESARPSGLTVDGHDNV